MVKSTIITDSRSLVKHFTRLCKSHGKLQFAVAWCGDPSEGFPFSYLKHVKGKIRAAVGVDFNHSHPKGIVALERVCSEVRIATNPSGIFHPKIYVFESPNRTALLFGSANFTKTGFSTNDEAAILLEGSKIGLADQLKEAQAALDLWMSDKRSKPITIAWLKNYRELYKKTQRILIKKARSANPAGLEGNPLPGTSFLGSATWEDYFARVRKSLNANEREENRNAGRWTTVLEARKLVLPKTWTVESFDEIEVRRFLFGSYTKGYGAFGNVGASGKFLGLLANGTKQQKATMASVMNHLRRIELPRDMSRLRSDLTRLCGLGQSMQVWGRMLLLERPELFFSVSYPNLRKNLSGELGIRQSAFSTPNGYLEAVRRIHSTEWYNSPRPQSEEERFVWDHRAALIDAILRDA